VRRENAGERMFDASKSSQIAELSMILGLFLARGVLCVAGWLERGL